MSVSMKVDYTRRKLSISAPRPLSNFVDDGKHSMTKMEEEEEIDMEM